MALPDSTRFQRQRLQELHWQFLWLPKVIVDQTLVLLTTRLDKRYSLGDAASVLIMRRMNIRKLLINDHPFEPEGFIRLLK